MSLASWGVMCVNAAVRSLPSSTTVQVSLASRGVMCVNAAVRSLPSSTTVPFC